MRKPAAAVIVVAVVFAAAYGATAYALSPPGPHFPTGFNVASLPAVTVSDPEAVDIRNLLGQSGAEVRYGITRAAYSDARKLLTDSPGTLYAIPGTTGTCLAFTTGTACSDPASDRGPLIALFRTDEASGDAVGGGIVENGVKSVTITTTDGVARTFATPKGFFVARPTDGLAMATAPFQYTVNR